MMCMQLEPSCFPAVMVLYIDITSYSSAQHHVPRTADTEQIYSLNKQWLSICSSLLLTDCHERVHVHCCGVSYIVIALPPRSKFASHVHVHTCTLYM